MNRTQWISIVGMLVLSTGSVLFAAEKKEDGKKKILMFSPSFGYRHSCVTRPMTPDMAHAEKVFKEIAGKAGYEVFFSQDHNDLQNDGQFNQFDAIVFYTTQAPPINREALLKWLRSGKALIGIHCATDSFYDWPEYAKLIGAQFKTHGPQDKEVTLKVEDTNHPATKMLGEEWVIADEIYQFRDGTFSKENVHVLLSVDNSKSDLAPQKMDKDKYYPVAWTNTEGKGRVFYTSLGHREDVWTNPKWQQHLLGGIAWTLDKKETDK